MAYVNMTVDGQTRRTSKIINKGADGSTKEATLEAVLEASDTQGGGITPSGNKMITTAQQEDVTQYATAQATLPSNFAQILKKGETVLGITGQYESAGGSDIGGTVDEACIMLEITNDTETIDLNDYKTLISNTKGIIGIRYDGQQVRGSATQEKTAYCIQVQLNGGALYNAKMFSIDTNGKVTSSAGSYFISYDNENASDWTIRLGTYGRKSMLGLWVFVPITD